MSDNKSESKLYFDIETTGLSTLSSHITVIGTAFSDSEGIHRKQFVCRKPTDEKKVLQEFASYIKGFDTLIHFNGRSFDIPYITSKCRFYQIRNTLYDMHEIDLYRMARQFSFLTRLKETKQKDVEKFFDFRRTDTISGSECVSAYMDYICRGSKEALEKLLLHNKEDLDGMIHIHSCLAGPLCIAEGRFSLTGISGNEQADPFVEDAVFLNANDPKKLPSVSSAGPENCLNITIETEDPFREPFSASYDAQIPEKGISFSFCAEGKKAVFSLKAFSGELRYYFEDYKDYYYLPEEGRAVHRSVGQFVDPAFREKAKKETAFEPVQAVFYPQCGSVIKPQFKISPDDRNGYFRLEDIKDPGDLKKLIIAAFHNASRG